MKRTFAVCSTVLTSSVANRYYGGRLKVDGVDYWQGLINLPVGRQMPPGTINDGSFIKTELDGIGASMSPSVIPFATQPVTTSPASWTCGGGCSVATGILAPDGTATAGEIDSGSAGNSSAQVNWLSTATSAGDWILFGAWVRRGANNTLPSSQFGPITVHSYGATDVFDQGSNTAYGNAFQMQVSGDWWHPMVVAQQAHLRHCRLSQHRDGLVWRWRQRAGQSILDAVHDLHSGVGGNLAG